MSIFKPEKLNIHGLAETPEKQEEVLFDPERDFTPQKKEEIRMRFITKQAEMERDTTDWSSFTQMALDIKILFPEMFEELSRDGKFLEQAIKILKKLRTDAENLDSWAFYIPELVKIRLIFLEKQAPVHDVLWRVLEGQVKRIKERLVHIQSSRSLVYAAMHEKMLFPERQSEQLQDVDLFDEVKDVVNEYQSQQNWDEFCELLVVVKILFPERFDELGIKKELLQKLVNDLLFVCERTGLWAINIHMAANLKIILAEKVEVTDKGLEITTLRKKEALAGETPPLPQTRKF